MRLLKYMFLSICCLALLPICLRSQANSEPDVEIEQRGFAVEFNPDGTKLAIGTTYILLYDAETGDSLQQLTPGLSSLPGPIHWSSDGAKIVLAGGKDGFIWDIVSGDLLHQFGGDSITHMYASALSKDALMIATSDMDSIIRVWSISTGELLYRLSYGSIARDLEFMSNDRRILATGTNGRFAILDLQSEEIEKEVVVDKQATGFWNVFGAISPDETLIATSSSGSGLTGEIKLWNAVTGDSVGILEGHSRYAFDLEFTSDGNYLLSAGADSTARIWNMSDRTLVLTLRGHNSQIVDASFSGDGKRVATVTYYDTVVRVWHLNLSSTPSDPVAGEAHMQVLHLHPNPATEQIKVNFQLPRSSTIQLRLVNQLGLDVLPVQEQFFEAGQHQLSLNLRSLPSGSYFSLLEANGHVVVNELNIIH